MINSIIRKSKRGVTLIELILAIAISAILLGTVGSILTNVMSTYRKYQDKSVAVNVANEINNEFRSILYKADKVNLIKAFDTDEAVDEFNFLYSKDNKIFCQHKTDFDNNYFLSDKIYKGFKLYEPSDDLPNDEKIKDKNYLDRTPLKFSALERGKAYNSDQNNDFYVIKIEYTLVKNKTFYTSSFIMELPNLYINPNNKKPINEVINQDTIKGDPNGFYDCIQLVMSPEA